MGELQDRKQLNKRIQQIEEKEAKRVEKNIAKREKRFAKMLDSQMTMLESFYSTSSKTAKGMLKDSMDGQQAILEDSLADMKREFNLYAKYMDNTTRKYYKGMISVADESLTTMKETVAKRFGEISDEFDEEIQKMQLKGVTRLINNIFVNIQNNIFMTSEYANEAFPTRARFEKTILSNAISYNINNINATPAVMDVHVGVIKSELDRILDSRTNPVYIIPAETPIQINLMTFRLEYDLKIVRKERLNGEYTYYAINMKPGEDTIVNENAYLPVPIFMDYMNEKYIFFDTKLRQVEVTDLNRKLISTNIIDNKAIDFTYKDQLYKFEVVVEEPDGNLVKVKPIFEGEYVYGEKWCTYYFVNSDTIRVKFSRKSYIPKINSNIKVRIYTTNGDKGNIKYRREVLFTASDGGKILKGIMLPTGDAYDGINAKSMEELKNIIPKERLSRGILSNDRDLENYFNIMDSNSRLKFFKKRHNQIERCYYSYLLVKDSRGNIIPTNTNDIRLVDDNFIESFIEKSDRDKEVTRREFAEKFLNEVDSAAVYLNVSTRFSDGGEFGFGGEIGISTQKLHARGPMGIRELTTTKYVIRGEGQIRE